MYGLPLIFSELRTPSAPPRRVEATGAANFSARRLPVARPLRQTELPPPTGHGFAAGESATMTAYPVPRKEIRMNREFRLALLMACSAMTSACTSEQFNRSMYEGTRARQDAYRPMDSGVTWRQTSPDFDQYQAERRRLHPAPADATPGF